MCSTIIAFDYLQVGMYSGPSFPFSDAIYQNSPKSKIAKKYSLQEAIVHRLFDCISDRDFGGSPTGPIASRIHLERRAKVIVAHAWRGESSKLHVFSIRNVTTRPLGAPLGELPSIGELP